MADDLKDVIQQNAEGPESAEVDGVRTKQHSLRDQIEADKYLAGKTSAQAGGMGFRFVKLSPPGAS